MAYACAYLGHQ